MLFIHKCKYFFSKANQKKVYNILYIFSSLLRILYHFSCCLYFYFCLYFIYIYHFSGLYLTFFLFLYNVFHFLRRHEKLTRLAGTALNSKLICHQKAFFAPMVVDAVLSVGSDLDVTLIGIKKVPGGSTTVC